MKKIWVKLKVFAPYDKIANVGTKFRLIDGKRMLINPDGVEAFSIRKGRFIPIDYGWEAVFKKDKETGKKVMVTPGLEEAKKKFDPAVFEFFKSKEQAMKACIKEEKLLKMLPFQRQEAKQKRVRDKVQKSRYGQKRPTFDDVIKEAKKVGVDLPTNLN